MAGPKLTHYRATGFAAGLLAAVFVRPDPAATQSWAAVVSAETECRAEPSPSADALGTLEIGSVILINQRTSMSSGQWMHVAPSRSGGYGVPGGCWVLSSKVARTSETGHFLQLVDRLLSAKVRPALDELLAVHNLLESPSWYRDRLEASAALTERRTALLAKAVEVAQSPRSDGRRAVDDPLVLAWIEALGERVRYSEDGRGRGRWTLVTGATEAEEEPSQSQQARPPAPPGGRELAVIGPNVACRTRPSRTAWSWRCIDASMDRGAGRRSQDGA